MSQFQLVANIFGEISPAFQGRKDLQVFEQGVSYSRNWLPSAFGGSIYRPGFHMVGNTKFNAPGVLKPFLYDEQLSYTLCLTEGYCRFFDGGSASLRDTILVDNISQGNPGVVTTDGNHDFVDGDEIYFEKVKGMSEVNAQFFTVKNATATTFELYDIDNMTPIDTSVYSEYVSGGDVSRVADVPSPYGEEDLEFVRHAQKAKAVYFVDGFHEPQLFSFDEVTQEWVFQNYTRTADPFTIALTNISNTSPRVFTIGAAKAYEDDEIVTIRGITNGPTTLNGKTFYVKYLSSTTFTLEDYETGAPVNAGTAWVAGGLVAFANDQPSAVAFYGGRLFFGGTANDPSVFWGSRAADDAGLQRYDDFTRGSNADDSIKFTIASQNNTVEYIRWFAGTPKFLAIGTMGGVYKATGTSGDGSAISNTSINVVPVDYMGVADKAPMFISSEIFFIQQQRRTLAQFGFDFYKDGYVSKDVSLFSPAIFTDNIKELAKQRGMSDTLWCVLEDGRVVAGVSKANENTAFTRIHTDGRFESVSSEINEGSYDTLYTIVAREVNGKTRRIVEVQSQDPISPNRQDFFNSTAEEDETAFAFATIDKQRRFVRVDSAVIYDGTQNAELTIDTVNNLATASIGMFVEGDIGRYISQENPSGYDKGAAKIIDYISPTEVEIEILADFTKTTLEPKKWELSTNRVTGLRHLEGRTVRILADGSLHSPVVVTNSCCELDDQYFYVVAGLPYSARMITNPMHYIIDNSGTLGVGYVSSIDSVAFKFIDTLGFKFGLDPYSLRESEVFTNQEFNSTAPLMQSKLSKEPALVGYNEENKLIIDKDDALPAHIIAIYCNGTVGGL